MEPETYYYCFGCNDYSKRNDDWCCTRCGSASISTEDVVTSDNWVMLDTEELATKFCEECYTYSLILEDGTCSRCGSDDVHDEIIADE